MHPDLQQGAEADGDGGEFIRLAAAYEVLRDPTRRATYDAHLSSRSKFVKSAFEFDPKAPPASDSVWQDEPMGDSHVAPWVWQYRQAVKEVVRYGGEGDGLAHLIKAEFGAAVRKAYFGPEVEDLPFGEWPMEFEGEERSVAGVGDIMHLVSGRHLLGTVREAQDILLGQGADASGHPTIEASWGEVRIESSENRESPSGRNAESDLFGTASFHETGKRNASFQANVKIETDGNDVELGKPPRSWDSANTSAKNGANPCVSDFQNAGQHPRQVNGTENGTRDRNGTFGGWANASEESSRGESARSLGEERRSEQRAFATLELTQHGNVLAVAIREWVPLGESGVGMDNRRRGVEEAECIDCISIYAVNRWDDSDEEKDGLGGERRERDREPDAPEEDQESCMGQGGRDRTRNGSGCGSRGGNRNGNGIGEGNGNGRGTGDGNGNGKEGGEKVGERGSESNGWAEDIENLGMRYKRPRLLARIFGLKEEGASIDVFHEGDVKTHTLLQYRTPLVRHVTWYRSDVDKRGRQIRKCEARLRRAAMLPSSLWLFEPRTSTHDCGGWYFERFDEEEPRGSPFARLQPNASQEGLSYIESEQGTDSRIGSNTSLPHKASYLAGSQKHFSSEKGWWDSSDGVSRVKHNQLRFEWPSTKGNGGLESASNATLRTTARARHAKPLDPAVYILTAAYLTLEKEEGTRTMRPSTVANLLDKGAKWTGELRSWWQKMAGV